METTTNQAAHTRSEVEAHGVIARQARSVLRTYSTSFFMVTRFLPPAKRAKVEAIYAVVRYPDEIVDTFPLDPGDQLARLNDWENSYDAALASASVVAAVERGVPCFLALFADVVRQHDIPVEYYRSFLAAMRLDAVPRTFATLDELVDTYIYGSAIVVGYFLTHVYGPNHQRDYHRAMRSARHLAIALQLTNFLRDVGEDQRRGRIYLPLDMLRAEGIHDLNVGGPSQRGGIMRVLRELACVAEGHYRRAAADVDAFAGDSQTAIRACIEVYRQLNDRISRSADAIGCRARVPFTRKYRVLPASKYWRLPLAYLSH